VNRSIEQMKRAAAMGAKLELCAVDPLIGRDAHLAWMQAWSASALREDGSRQSKRGCRALHLGIDLGQTGNPSHTDGLQMFPTDLLGEGITSVLSCQRRMDCSVVRLGSRRSSPGISTNRRKSFFAGSLWSNLEEIRHEHRKSTGSPCEARADGVPATMQLRDDPPCQ
jgi:hypothetical protein